MVEFEDLTAEEFKGIQEKASKVEDLEKTIGEKADEYEKAKGAWDEEKATLEKDQNPNWGKVRGQMDKMRKELEDKGFKFDNEGNAIPPSDSMTREEVDKRASEVAMKTILGNKLGERLDDYDEEAKGLIKHQYDKLVANENVTLQSVDKYFNQAVKVAEMNSEGEIKMTADAITRGATQGPRSKPEGQTKLEDSEAKDMGTKMGLKFIRKEDK
jgi:hypothetical protein